MSSINLTLEGIKNDTEHGILSLDQQDDGFHLQLEVYGTQVDGTVLASLTEIVLCNGSLPHVLHMLQAMTNLIQHHIAYDGE